MAKIEIIENEECKGRVFQKGETYDFIGTENRVEGCHCNNSYKTYDVFVILMDFVKYYVPFSKAKVLNENCAV